MKIKTKKDFIYSNFINKDIILVDIDRFRYINHEFGNKIGDLVINLFQEKLILIFGFENVFRFTGNEYLIFVEQKDIFNKLKKFNKEIKNTSFPKLINIKFSYSIEHYNPFDSFESQYKSLKDKIYEIKSKKIYKS